MDLMSDNRSQAAMKRISLGIALATTLLTACGGGGGGGGGGGDDGGPPTGPSGLTYEDSVVTYLVHVEIEANAPTVEGQVTGWSIAPSLPDGLELDPESGVLHGTPVVESEARLYVVTAKGPAGSTQGTIDLEVVLPARFAYTASSDDALGIYTVDAFTGDLRFHGLRHHVAPDAGAEQVAVHPSGRFLYVPNRGNVQEDSTVTAYEVDPGSGALELVGHAPIGEGPHRLAIHPDGTHAYGISFPDNVIHVYAVHSTTGALTVQHTIQTNTGPERLALHPHGRFLYVTHGPSSDIAIFTVHPDGSLTRDDGGFNYYDFTPTDVDVDPEGGHAYFVFEVTNTLVSYAIEQGTGALTLTEESPTSGRPNAVRVHPRGGFAYVASDESDTVDLYALDPVDGGASRLATYSVADDPEEIVFDPSGRQLYVLSGGEDTVQAFAADPKTGILTPLGEVRTRAAAMDLGVLRGEKPALPREEFLYVAHQESDDVAGFEVDAATGHLTPIGSNVLAGDGPAAVAVDPAGDHLWVANEADGSISILNIDPLTGALSSAGPAYELGGTPGGLAVDVAGDHLYVSLSDADQVLGLAIAADGTLQQVDAAPTTDAPGAVSTDPTGQFVYVSIVGQDAHTLTAYRVLQGQFLAPGESEPAPGHPGPVRFSPGGERGYVALKTSNVVVPYAIDSVTGALTVLASGSKAVSTGPSVIELTPDGLFAYAAVPGKSTEAGFVARFAVDPATGDLGSIGETHEGLSPIDLAIGPTGRFLYVCNQAGDDLTVFEIDAASGDLTPLEHVATGLSPRGLILVNRVD